MLPVLALRTSQAALMPFKFMRTHPPHPSAQSPSRLVGGHTEATTDLFDQSS